MNNFYISNMKEGSHIHFVGIGGISMSGLAEVFLQKGYRVTGSDIRQSHITRRLTSLGAQVYIGHDGANIAGADLVVYTAAVNWENPELIAAKQSGILAIERATLLGALMREYKCSICVSGTHGKTTTTSMLSHVLLHSGCDPTIMLGGELDAIGGNTRTGSAEYFLTEACEYHCSFLQFFPTIAIITNVDADHLDFFKDLDQIKAAFTQFAHIPGRDGFVIVCGDDTNAVDCVANTSAQCVCYGLSKSNDVRPDNLIYQDGCGIFDVDYNGKLLHVQLHVPGTHNVKNALACIAAGRVMNLPAEKVASGLEAFTLVHRRFEKKGMLHGAAIIDDYAHHPTEISCTLETAKKITPGRLFVAFQPHTYSRTLLLLDEFEKAFDCADDIIITDIYAAREKDNGRIHAKDLVKRLQDRGKAVRYIPEFSDIAAVLERELASGDTLITMGAGSIYQVADLLLKR